MQHSLSPWHLFLLYIWASLPRKEKAVSHTVTSQEQAEADADTPAPIQMDPEVKYADQVTCPVASCKFHTLANFESVAMSYF